MTLGCMCLWNFIGQNFMPPFVFNPQIFFSALFFIGSLISVKSLLVVDTNTPNSFRQVLHGTAGGMSPQVQARSQQLPGSTPVSTSNFIFLIVYIVWLEFLPLSLGEKKIHPKDSLALSCPSHFFYYSIGINRT